LALAPARAERCCLDLPDHGRASDELQGDARALEDTVARQVARLGNNLVLVGHSYGAYLSARLASRLRGHVSRVVLISGLGAVSVERAAHFLALARQIERGELALERLAPTVAESWYGPDAAPQQRDSVGALLQSTGRVRTLRLLARLAQLCRPELEVTPYSAPARVLHAEGDAAVPLELGRRLATLSAASQLSILPGCSHMLPLTHPAAVAAAAFST
jgi:3-oxoadipate enol-lactonase